MSDLKETNLPGRRGCSDEGDKGPAIFRMAFGWDVLGVEAGFTGRRGGVSPAPWDSLNLSFTRPDSPENVMENHRRLCRAFGHPLARCVRARQVHGARVARVSGCDAGIAPQVRPQLDETDALITNEPGLVLMTSHADCVPVYFLDDAHRAIGLAHAGWAGVLVGVVEATLAAMGEAFGTRPEGVRIGIGPHIRGCCFEVGAEVLARFQGKSWWRDAFAAQENGRHRIDLSRCIRGMLTDAGVPPERIAEDTRCTRCECGTFFSHRGGGGHSGTNSAWLVLTDEGTADESAGAAAEAITDAATYATVGESADAAINATAGETAEATADAAAGLGGADCAGACHKGIISTILLSVLFLLLLLPGCGSVDLPADGQLPGTTTASSLTAGALGLPTGADVSGEAMAGPEAVEGKPVAGLGEVLLEDAGPAPGGTLRLFMKPADVLDPFANADPEVADLGWFLADPLVRIAEKGNVTPCLATGIQSSQAGRLWDFSLVAGVRLHDGTTLEAEDAVASIRRAAETADGPYASGLANLEKVEAVGRLRVRVILRTPDPAFTRNLALPVFSRNAWKTVSGNETFTPVGTGAYQFGIRDAEGITLERAEAWWGAQDTHGSGHAAWPDHIRFVFGATQADRLTLFQQRRIDATWSPDADMSRFLNRNDIEVRTFAGNRAEFLAVGSKSVVLQRPEIRTIVLRYLAGCLAEGGLKGERVADGLPDPVDAASALELLAAAGCRVQRKGDNPPVLLVPATQGMRQAALTIRYNALNLDRLGTADWLAGQLAEIGISVFRQEATGEEARKMTANGQFDLLLLGCEVPAGTPDGGLGAAMRAALGARAAVSDMLPLYRERLAMLYSTRIRGEKRPTALYLYGGWPDWYLLGNETP